MGPGFSSASPVMMQATAHGLLVTPFAVTAACVVINPAVTDSLRSTSVLLFFVAWRLHRFQRTPADLIAMGRLLQQLSPHIAARWVFSADFCCCRAQVTSDVQRMSCYCRSLGQGRTTDSWSVLHGRLLVLFAAWCTLCPLAYGLAELSACVDGAALLIS